MSDRPYPEGIAWDEALRQRRALEALDVKHTIALKALYDIAWRFNLDAEARIEMAREALRQMGDQSV